MGRLGTILRRLWTFVRFMIIVAGILAIVTVCLGFTSVPWKTYLWLASDEFAFRGKAEYVVILGGGGIPSESGLMRTYYGASAAKWFADEAKVIVALPDEPDEDPSSLDLMVDELVMRGVDRKRILREDEGRNTREQAIRIASLLGDDFEQRRVLLVTSPEHMRRSLLTFRKAGFLKVMAWPAMDVAVKLDLVYESDELGGHWSMAPDVGHNLMFRYAYWNNMQYALRSSREFTALAYYWLRGWI